MLSPVPTLPDQKYKTLSGEMIFSFVLCEVYRKFVCIVFILVSLIGFPTGIISAHCIYATNVGLWSHLEHVSQVAIEIVTFRLSGGADYCNLLWSSKNT